MMIAPPWHDVPPQGYGGIEFMLAQLITGLVRRGHDVTLIGAGHTAVPARFLRTFPRAPSQRIGEPMPELLQAAQAHRMLTGLDADIVHDHSRAGPLTAAARTTPTLVTCHSCPVGEFRDYYRALGTSVFLVAISEAQRLLAPDLNWVATVYNALDVATFPYRERKEDWVLWLGRFCDYKGAHLAIDAARAARRRIVLAGKLVEPVEHAYFDQHVRPRLGPDVSYVGEAGAQRKRRLLAAARCLLFPIQWEEPFGMVMIEAMACGTPVVALARGSVPEIVVHGRTGFALHNPEELPDAIDAAGELDPLTCRRHVERYFDVHVMAEGYERVYQQLVPNPAANTPQRSTHSNQRR
ncbi:glycosyltransferase family 4 protein [Nonomuraea polychroma]|uniref:glycosyltransferase family 4 protein n=1 Tax=Nonomuraea polychroma TaxID=46176 RepID=UPI001F4DC945|nr:glycosyltransferase family 4 protein [Nonomuraea polychroma]